MSGDSRASFKGAFDAAASKAGWRSGIAPEEASRNAGAILRTTAWRAIRGKWRKYANDLTLRSTLQRVLTELTPAHPKCAGALLQDIKRIDSELMTVLSREVFTDFPEGEWWLRNAPQYGAHHFCEDFKRAYGVEIPVRSQYDNDVAAMLRLLEAVLRCQASASRCDTRSGGSRAGLISSSLPVRESFLLTGRNVD